MDRTVIETRLRESQERVKKLQARLSALVRETQEAQAAYNQAIGETQCLARLLPEFDKGTGKGEGDAD